MLPRFLMILAGLAVAVTACDEDNPGAGSRLPGDDGDTGFVVSQDVAPAEGEGEGAQGEGEGEGAQEGEGEGGEGEGAQEGEGEGAGGPRELVLVCGSAPDRVVQPDPIRVTGTVILPDGICGAHFEIRGSGRDPRTLQFVAVETLNAPPCAGGRRMATIERPFIVNQPEQLGEWTIEMVHTQGPTIFRKTVSVDAAGAEPAAEGETCAGEHVGFIGDCGEELTCRVPTPANPTGYVCKQEEGLCEESNRPACIHGTFGVSLTDVQKACRVATEGEVPAEQCLEEPAEPQCEGGFYCNPLEVQPASLTIEQEDDGQGGCAEEAFLSFSGESVLARWTGDKDTAIRGTVVGSTFLRDPDADNQSRGQGVGNCTELYFLEIPSVTRYGQRLVGNAEIAHLEVNCGRGCLACDLAGKIVTAGGAPE